MAEDVGGAGGEHVGLRAEYGIWVLTGSAQLFFNKAMMSSYLLVV